MEMKLKFSFDECAKLAVENPAAFEEYRKQLLEHEIQCSNPCNQRRLKGVQFEIDMARRKSKTPMASCLKVYALMMDYFYDKHLPIVNNCDVRQYAESTIKNNKKADVVRFPD